MIEAVQQENHRLAKMQKDLIALVCPGFVETYLSSSLDRDHLAHIDRGLAILAGYDAGLWLIERAQQQEVAIFSSYTDTGNFSAGYSPTFGIILDIRKDPVMRILHGGAPRTDIHEECYLAIGHELRHAWQSTALTGVTGNGRTAFHPLQGIITKRFEEGDAGAFECDVAVGLKDTGEEIGFHEMMGHRYQKGSIRAYSEFQREGRDIALRRAFDAQSKSAKLARFHDEWALNFCEHILHSVKSKATYEEMQLASGCSFVPSGAADIPDPEVLGQTPWGTNYLTGTSGPDLKSGAYNKLSWRVARRLRGIERRWDEMVRTYG